MDPRTIRRILMIKDLLENKKKQLCLRTRYFQMESSRILQLTLETTFKTLSKRMWLTVVRDSLKWMVVLSMHILVMVPIT